MTERLRNVLANRKVLLSTAVWRSRGPMCMTRTTKRVRVWMTLQEGSGRADEARPGVTTGRRSGPSSRIKSLYA